MNPDSEKMEPMEWAKFVIRNRNENGYSRAYNIFITNAREGDADAEYNLGLMYARGQGVPKDYDAALSWFQKAHEKGHKGAMYFLGKMYATGVGVQKDSRMAERLFLKCADEDVRAQYEIGLLYFKNEDIPRNLDRSAKWMLRAANNGHVEAQFMIGQFYKTGAGVPKDVGKAVEWLTSAALISASPPGPEPARQLHPRRSKLHIPHFRPGPKARSFRCSSSPNRTRFAGLRFGYSCPARSRAFPVMTSML